VSQPLLPFISQDDWVASLAEHHDSSTGVWIRLAKKGSGVASVTYAEAVEVALCYGWIDGQAKTIDDRFYMQRFSPRSARSKWSKINCGKVVDLIERGLIQPAGLREVERAKADGRWDAAYDPPSTAQVPPELTEALERSPAAQDAFAALDSRNRYAILFRIADAKRPETKARRIEKFVAMLAEGGKIYP